MEERCEECEEAQQVRYFGFKIYDLPRMWSNVSVYMLEGKRLKELGPDFISWEKTGGVGYKHYRADPAKIAAIVWFGEEYIPDVDFMSYRTSYKCKIYVNKYLPQPEKETVISWIKATYGYNKACRRKSNIEEVDFNEFLAQG